MARKSLLSAAISKTDAPEANENAPVVAAPIVQAKRVSSNKGKYHLGGYYDHDVPEVEAFRVLSVKNRRSQQELLLEAVRDLVEKYEAQAKFG